MSTLDILLFTISIVIIFLGLLLSNTGSGSGINTLSGQDIELFKKTKTRGVLKKLQILLFILGLTLLIIAVVVNRTRGNA
jgi:preprotein translocase subunit SecG